MSTVDFRLAVNDWMIAIDPIAFRVAITEVCKICLT